MAIPTAPNASGLISEAMRRALGRTVSSGEVSRGLDHWIPEIHGDIWAAPGGHTSKLVEFTAVVLATEGKQLYDFPSDADAIIDIVLLDGTARDTLQSATASTATLVSTDASVDTARIGRELVILSGTGSGQRRTIYGWTAPQATSLSANWSTIPSGTYLVADTYVPLIPTLADEFNLATSRTERDRPSAFTKSARTYLLAPVPDKTYPLLVRYWVDLQKVDLASDAFADMLSKWRSVYTQGIFVKTLQDEDDARKDTEYVIYQAMISRIVGKGTQSGMMSSHET